MCEQEAKAINRLGPLAAEALKKRISDIRVAEYVDEVLAGQPRIAQLNGTDCVQFDLADNYVLSVTANHIPPRVRSNGQTDWTRVRRVKVTTVEQ